jgi:hypothetical protein
VYGALKLTVKMLLMWNSLIQIDGIPDDFMLATSTVETSNLVILRVCGKTHFCLWLSQSLN